MLVVLTVCANQAVQAFSFLKMICNLIRDVIA